MAVYVLHAETASIIVEGDAALRRRKEHPRHGETVTIETDEREMTARYN